MALAVNTLGTSGGIAVCSEGKVIASMTLDRSGDSTVCNSVIGYKSDTLCT